MCEYNKLSKRNTLCEKMGQVAHHHIMILFLVISSKFKPTTIKKFKMFHEVLKLFFKKLTIHTITSIEHF